MLTVQMFHFLYTEVSVSLCKVSLNLHFGPHGYYTFLTGRAVWVNSTDETGIISGLGSLVLFLNKQQSLNRPSYAACTIDQRAS